MITKSNVLPPDTASDDLRIGHYLYNNKPEKPRVVLIGFESDEGVRINGGRTGAAEAPDSIRQALYKLTPHGMHAEAYIGLLRETYDAGNIQITGDVEHDQQCLGRYVANWLERGAIPLIIGGGHETSFGHFLGYVEQRVEVELINIDAHADVRPLKDKKAHSGSPFYQALSHTSQLCKKYHVAGLQPWSVAQRHLDFMGTRKCQIVWRDEFSVPLVESMLTSTDRSIMFSMDMDAVDQTAAPGVSAPNTRGLSTTEWLACARAAGASSAVKSFDLVEVNPLYDVDSRTVRLGAVTIWHFLDGLTQWND